MIIRAQLNELPTEKLRQKQLLIDIIRLQNQAKEIFHESASIFSTCILVFLISTMIFMACSILQFDVVDT